MQTNRIEHAILLIAADARARARVRASVSAVAEAVGLSHSPCTRRIQTP